VVTPTRWLIRAFVLGSVLSLLAAGPAGAEEFDRSIPVTPGATLDVRLFGGEVVLRGWARDEVRVRATHFRTDEIDLQAVGLTVTLRARARRGTPHAIDLAIDVPTWMGVSIAGTYVDISVTGTRGSINAQTVRGDVRVKGGHGAIALKSIEGEVVLEGAEGRADLSATNNGIRVTGLTGDLFAETVNGSVTLQAIQSRSVVVGTVGGDVTWDGSIARDGRYQFATHDGDIDVTLGARPDVTVSVRAFEGVFHSAFPVQAPTGRGQAGRATCVIGSGAAHLELETYRGTISLRRRAAR
jgi:DUF4097 and DUF4098 domain-containing protein YvlB